MASSKYEVVSQTVEVLLSPNTAQFEVPKFQRTYSWGADEINQLIDDVFGQSSRDDLPYFLGSIVLATKENKDGGSPDIILDGQQRLTTISLIIAVLIYKMSEAGIEDANENKTYLFSRRVHSQRKPKLLLQDEDQRSYEALLNEPFKYDDPKYRNTRIGVALSKIFKSLEDYAQKHGSQQGVRKNPYEHMLDRILDDVELVRINAPNEKDAFRLFETLNDRGLALSAADLIKNKLLYHCGPEIDDAFDAWSNMIALTKDDDVVNYLRYYWIAFRGFVRKLGLFDIYKNHINTLDSTAATLFAFDLEEGAKDYQQIINPNIKTCTWGPDVAESLDRLNSYRARSCRPAILACSKFRRQDVKKIIDLCETITVRYSIVGEKNPNQLEGIYSELCTALRDPNQTLGQILNASFLSTIPSDEEFKQKLASTEVQSVTPAWREILVRLNSAIGTGETKIQSPARVHVEHILPQNPRAVVLNESGLTVEEAARLIPRIGNLTLLSGRKNREASNKPFSLKRQTYTTSEVALTKDLIRFSKWSKAEIDNRSNELTELAAKIYPHPSNILL